MSPETRAEFMRLKRWLGKERARYDRIASASTTYSGQDRARSESNVCTLTMTKIDSVLRKASEKGSADT